MSQLSQSTREEVLEAYGRECIFCEVSEEEHKEEHGRSLDIHHLVPDRAGGPDEPENLVPLCISCHKTMEATHGKAMKQVAKESGMSNVGVEEYNQVKKALQEKEETISDLREASREHESNCDKAAVDRQRLLEWLADENFKVSIHVVHETNFTTSQLLYAGLDPDVAQEKYAQAENHVTMETYTITGIPLQEAISETAVDRLHTDPNWWLDGFVVDGLKPMVTGESDE